MSLLTIVKSNPRLKKFVHWLIVQTSRSAPRLWVKLFVNPFLHKRIGANSVITAGVTIGKHSVIGAGSVITKGIPEYCVAVGNLAKVIKKYNFETSTWDSL